MQMLSIGIVLTGQGIPFIHAGQEFCRTKKGDENSYKSSDAINGIDWNRKSTYKMVNDFTKKLIELRKSHPAFRLGDQALVQKHVSFPFTAENMIIMRIEAAPKESWKDIFVVYNGSKKSLSVRGFMSDNAKLVLTTVNRTDGDKWQIPGQSFTIYAVE
jgi:pullulanase